MMDEAAPRRVSGFERLIKRGDGQRGIKPFRQGPSDSFAREGVKDHGKIGKGLCHVHIGDVGHPDLIRPRGHKAAHQIGHDHDGFRLALRRQDEGLVALGEQIVLAHKPQYFLGIYDMALPA